MTTTTNDSVLIPRVVLEELVSLVLDSQCPWGAKIRAVSDFNQEYVRLKPLPEATTVDQMVTQYADVWYQTEPVNDQIEFINCSFDNLIIYHHTMGADIRSFFSLWKRSWDRELVDGIDVSPNHPDALSQRVIEALWKQAQHVNN